MQIQPARRLRSSTGTSPHMVHASKCGTEETSTDADAHLDAASLLTSAKSANVNLLSGSCGVAAGCMSHSSEGNPRPGARAIQETLIAMRRRLCRSNIHVWHA